MKFGDQKVDFGDQIGDQIGDQTDLVTKLVTSWSPNWSPNICIGGGEQIAHHAPAAQRAPAGSGVYTIESLKKRWPDPRYQ